jgi:CRP-like cAMP-binding protein
MEEMSRAALLKKVPLFSTCSAQELETVGAQMEAMTVPKGKVLIVQGRGAYRFFVILQGRVAVVVDDNARGELGPGDFFGEISMLGGGAASATMVALERTKLLAISQKQLREFAKANQWLLVKLLRVMDLRERKDYAAWRRRDRLAPIGS